MPKCSTCGIEHDILDPTFRRPEPYIQLSETAREQHAKASDDLCRIGLPNQPTCYFVRGVLPVSVSGLKGGVWWGLWAEIDEPSFRRVVELWSAENQREEPPFEGTLANVVPGYADTLGLGLAIQLTGVTSRPEFRFTAGREHAFVQECEAGVDAHRAGRWNELMILAP